MKLLNWTRRFSRRGFLAGGATAMVTVAITGPGVLADPQASGTEPAQLQPEDIRTLVKFTRDLFPHDRLDDSFYVRAVAPLGDEAGKDVSTRRLLVTGFLQLDRLAMAAAGVPYAQVSDETTRVAVIKQIESSAFFTKVYGATIVGLYNQPELWPKFGYEGPSSAKGGYISRGFSDIDWL
jgi:hypothetical protein